MLACLLCHVSMNSGAISTLGRC